MSSHQTLRRVVIAASLLVAFLFQGTWALAGVTGNIAGTVKDTSGAPVAGVTVQAIAPSQTATATTDAGGHFIILSLSPDTYTLNLTKDQYEPTSIPGQVVFADQTQQVAITLQKKLRQIAHVTSQAGASLVKSGVGGDLYSVNAATQQASAALGGGGSLNSTYSAIASVPGLYVGTGNMGWNQAVVIRGQNPWTTGFEYDGVPVNRAFDQYNTSTETNLGLSELQIYTGGGPGSISSSGISGFINTVIKTGTYPGYASLTGGIGTDAFYHQAAVEAGGSTPDRNFSYYVGVSGYNQAFRYLNDQNGATYMQPGQVYSNYGNYYDGYIFGNLTSQGVVPLCNPGGSGPGTLPDPSPLVNGCLLSYFGLTGFTSFITDREDIVNFHVGIPRANGLRDDIQLLWSGSAERTFTYNSPNESGPGLNATTLAVSGANYQAGVNYPHYNDSITYNLPFGTNVQPGGSGTPALPYQYYMQPNAPAHSFWGALPSNAEDLFNNDTGIVKLQLTHAISDRAYLRVYGYSMFSDWTEDGQNMSSYGYETGVAAPLSPNYNLITHTSGGQLQFADQFNDQNLLTFTGNYTTASTSRLNNTGFLSYNFGPGLYNYFGLSCNPGSILTQPCAHSNPYLASSPIGYISQKNGVFTCWDPATGKPVPCYDSGAYKSTAFNGPTGSAPAGTPATRAGAYWATLWNGNASATYNTVKPQFVNLNLQDEFRPNDKLLINLGVRYDNYDYILPNTDTPADQFYAQIISKYLCWSPTLGTAISPLAPGAFPPPAPVYGGGPGGAPCPNGYKPGAPFTVSSPSSYDIYYYSPRYSVTYTESPDTVWRFSGGRYAEPPLTAAVQYENLSGNAQTLWANFTENGFYSPFHAIPGESSAQYDLSYEHHVHGTDWSFKITPFYGTTSNWEQQSFIGQGFVTQIPVGLYRNYGAELAITKGDFSRNGLSGQLAFTYTKAQTQYQNGIVPNQISLFNKAIMNYNCLTASGYNANKAACNALTYTAPGKCYELYTGPSSGPGYSAVNCNAKPVRNSSGQIIATPVLNPYYNSAPQPLEDTNGWYQGTIYQQLPGLGTAYGIYAQGFASPYVGTLILNYRENKLAITPSIQIQAGTQYGSPVDVTGLDPRVCEFNQGFTGVATTNNPKTCDYRTIVGPGVATSYGYLFIPNPATGQFASPGTYTEPTLATGNIQVSYDVTPRIKLTATATNIFNTCWGGSSTPWSAQYPPAPHTCGYNTNSFYTANYYNGSSPYDKKANGATPLAFEANSDVPTLGNGAGGFNPFNVYLQAQIRL